MPGEISMQVVPVQCGSERLDGRLVYVDGAIVAVLTHLKGAHYGRNNGAWYIEAGFGTRGIARNVDPFPTLEAVTDWIQDRIQYTDDDGP